MERKVLVKLGIPVLILAVAYIYLSQHYHSSIKGALIELDRKWEGEILVPQMDQSRFAYLIDKKGNIFLAEAPCQYDIISFCKDFKTYPSNLNIYDSPKEYKSFYSKIQNNGKDIYLILGKDPSGYNGHYATEDITLPFPIATHLKNAKMKEKANDMTLYISYAIPMSPDPTQFESRD
ncbi:hypothetical protein [Neobacillus sp.]|uniref:hypothetical protein n=1 Tax=Neobacillus sp. TaxID=2675273 RepID=UPI0028A1B153|nr:hypothetical protein [Neobacillus sp.]